MAGDIVIAAGFGFRAGASSESLLDALAQTGGRPDLIATASAKARAPAIRALAEQLGVTLCAIDPAQLRQEATLTQSPASLAAHHTGSVAEAAALAAAGPNARLLGPRIVSADGMATCALAEGART